MAEIMMNFQSGVLSAAPGSAGTTLTSGNFAFLPAIVAPQTMRLALDPDGLVGTPEIVIVTAHTAFATTCTVTRAQETSYGAGAARAHAIDTIWRHVLTRASIVEMTVPAGSIMQTVAATPDTGYVFIDGSTLVNGQVLYPVAWLRIPAAWQSAPNIVLPDWRGRTLFSDDTGAVFTLGGLGGANTHSITQAELPAATITIDPPNTAVTVVDTGHIHSVDPPHAPVTSGFGGDPVQAFAAATGSPPTGLVLQNGASSYGILDVDVPAFNSVSATTGISASVNIAPFASGNLGSGTAIDTRPAYGVVNFQLKVH